MALYFDFAMGFAVPPFWLNKEVRAFAAQRAKFDGRQEYLGNLYQCPLEIKLRSENENSWWRLPFDPVISVSGKNIIVRRNVQKTSVASADRRGSIKELWAQDDYEISIAGVFMNSDSERLESDIRRLRKYCEAREPLSVRNDLFTVFNITKIAVESYDLPHTKGVENQMWTIKGYSDDDFDLLVLNQK